MAAAAVSEFGSTVEASSASWARRRIVGGRCERRESMREEGAESIIGIVVLGGRRSGRVAKGESCCCCCCARDCVDVLPDWRELRKFWTRVVASVGAEPDGLVRRR